MGVGAALPIVDLASFASAEDLGAELMRVGRNPGFFYVVGHDLGDDVASHVFKLAQHFFDAPAEEKLAYGNGSGDLFSADSSPPFPLLQGYTGMREETLSGKGPGDVKESFYLADPGTSQQPLPPRLDRHREQLAAFFHDCDALAKKLLKALAIGLGVPQDYLSKAHTGESCRMRLINYPAVSCESPTRDAVNDDSGDIRAGAHSDYGSLTLLFRQPSDQGGLQVLRQDDSAGPTWIDVPCLPNAIVVNIGDALEFWTAGRLRSTVHRVAFPRSAKENVARLSIPVFIQPDRNVVLAPIGVDGGTSKGQPAVVDAGFLDVLKRKGYASAAPVTSHEHLTSRIRATYAKS
ncbi:2OG-Fe(II) oxygenase family protein [Verticillium alfalfae VaMs.102]|uniref:2OG-Fe(II) oxygenase family protein n=1 Tax=Verticillium alfalfae (strain VaMs.102 / ATCC MYA-4576 / FGSC 10136) TaxID=526221 RepID=C9SDS4_VERA1|nr:2OG-Fe(II) oxygenase family protein [Verticillium alfalfae VaMs.102]EEY17194.1 2OG-Fe(II) oxygenase family protein [Verticillium alfalfae VaMs.102]